MMTTNNDTNEISEDSTTGRWQTWKIVMIALGGVSAFFGNFYAGTAYAAGAAGGTLLVYVIIVGAATAIYRRFEWLQLGLIPSRVYAGICVVSAAVSIPVAIAMFTQGASGFLMTYILLGGIALAVQFIRQRVW